MTDIVIQSEHDPALTPDQLGRLIEQAGNCLETHRVHWRALMISEEGTRLFCHLQGPDAESVRIAFRQAGLRPGALWPARVHTGRLPVHWANAVLEWLPGALADDPAGWPALPGRIVPVCSFVSYGQEHRVSLVRLPAGDAGRLPVRMPFLRLWAFRRLQVCPSLSP